MNRRDFFKFLAAGAAAIASPAILLKEKLEDRYLGKIYVHNGDGTGQWRTVVEYTGTTKVATIDWSQPPDSSSYYTIVME